MITIKRLNSFVLLIVVLLFGHNNNHVTARVIQKRQASTASSDLDPCTTATCLNGGVCFRFGNVAHCKCPDGYGGYFCQTMVNPSLTNPSAITVTANANINDLCQPNPCKNGGICLPVLNNMATCACPGNFTGIYCQLLNGVLFVATTDNPVTQASSTAAPLPPLNPDEVCFVGACLNGGTCRTIDNMGFCTCLPNFSGSRCEFPQNGVTLPPNFFTSTAAGGSGGVTPCNDNNPCLNNSTCLLINGQPKCFCNGATDLQPFCASPNSPGAVTSTPSPFSNCPPNSCNGQPCLIISNSPVCFCGAGLLPPNCTPEPGATTTQATATVVTASCPASACNGQPCINYNNVQLCFCLNNSNDPNCA